MNLTLYRRLLFIYLFLFIQWRLAPYPRLNPRSSFCIGSVKFISSLTKTYMAESYAYNSHRPYVLDTWPSRACQISKLEPQFSEEVDADIQVSDGSRPARKLSWEGEGRACSQAIEGSTLLLCRCRALHHRFWTCILRNFMILVSLILNVFDDSTFSVWGG